MMTQYPVRIPPLNPARFTPEQAELVGAWTHLNFSKVIARNPGMYRTFVPFIEQLIARTTLPPRDREVLVIRTLGLSDETYEAHHHAQIAPRSGLEAPEIDRIARGDPGLPAWDRLLAGVAEELVATQRVGDANWAALAQRYDETQLMEVVFLVGCYTTMAMLTKSFGIEIEADPEVEERLEALRQYT